MDKGSTTPLPPINKEKVQAMQEDEPQKISIGEVSKEGKIYEEPQQTSQDIEVGTVDSIYTGITNVDPSQKERNLERSDKGNGIAKKTPSSSKYMSLMETTPRWLNKEVMVMHKRQLYCSGDERTK